MGSVSSVNPGVSDLLQTLSSLNSPVLSSSTVESALENAPTTDIVQLSIEAAQLQNVDTLFGISAASTTASSTTSPAGQLSDYQNALQSSEAQALLGAATTTGLTGTGSILNLTA